MGGFAFFIGALIFAGLWYVGGGTFFAETVIKSSYGDVLKRTTEFSWIQLVKFSVMVLAGGAIGGFLGSAIMVVREKLAVIIEVLGKYYTTKPAGLRLMVPKPFGRIAGEINLRQREFAETIGAKSKDNAFLEVPVKIQYKVADPKKAHYELDNPEGQIKSYIVNTVRSEANDMLMDEIFKSKDQFESAVRTTLNERFGQYGFEIVNVLVDEPQPSDKLKKEFDEVLASHRRMEAAKNDAQAKKIKLVGEAEAEGESLKIRGEAFKKFRNLIAEGNSEAMQRFLQGAESLTERDVLQFMAIIDRHEAIRDASRHPGTLVVVPTNFDQNSMAPQIAALTDRMAHLKTKQPGE